MFPFLSPEFVVSVGCIFVRMTGFFFSVPIFSDGRISNLVRVFFIFSCSALFFYANGENNDIVDGLSKILQKKFILSTSIVLIKELLLGYLLGLCLAFLLNSIQFAGELCSSSMGLTSAQTIDPTSGTSQSIFSHFFGLICLSLILIFDFHHYFFFLLRDSFGAIPIDLSFSEDLIHNIVNGSSKMFVYGIRFVLIPYSTIFFVTVSLGLMAKTMPEMNIFIVGFPVRIFVGFCALVLSTKFLPETLRMAFWEYFNLTTTVKNSIISTS